MYLIKTLLFVCTTFFMMSSFSAIDINKLATYKIYGSCSMCKKTIEKAGNLKNIAKVDWDKETKMAILTFDSTKTNAETILKRIGLAGYDSELFYAPDDTYAKLPTCCQYNRRPKPELAKAEVKTMVKDIPKAETVTTPIVESKKEINQLKPIFDNYFALKNALVKTDVKSASAFAKEILIAITLVKMENLTGKEHIVWMKLTKDLEANTTIISTLKEIEKQRTAFIGLSKNIYALLKVSKQATPTYYQYCPMANDGKGANWLSKEAKVMNPYYGSQMLNCGKVVETIK
jgi:copper chaperone CopZ